MYQTDSAQRLASKSILHALQVELQQGYALSPVEAQVLARRVQQLVNDQLGQARQPGQITYQAIAIEEPAGKALRDCRKVPVHLTITGPEDSQVWAEEGPEALRQLRVQRLVYEALMQGGALSQEDIAYLLGISVKTVGRIFAFWRDEGQRLPSRGEIQDMGRGVSHKVQVIKRYLQDLSFSRIAAELGNHGLDSMARYLRHFALVMVLEERGLKPEQMQSIIGISHNLIQQYRTLYQELNVPEHQRTLQRLQQVVFAPATETAASSPEAGSGEKGGPA